MGPRKKISYVKLNTEKMTTKYDAIIRNAATVSFLQWIRKSVLISDCEKLESKSFQNWRDGTSETGQPLTAPTALTLTSLNGRLLYTAPFSFPPALSSCDCAAVLHFDWKIKLQPLLFPMQIFLIRQWRSIRVIKGLDILRKKSFLVSIDQ